MCASPPHAHVAPATTTIRAQGFAAHGGPRFFLRDGRQPSNHAGIQGTRYGPLQRLGDLSDEKVKRDVEAVMKDAIGFFAKCVLA